MEEGTQNGQHEHRTLSHVTICSSVSVRSTPLAVCTLGHIGRILARRARSTRGPVPRHVWRAELLMEFKAP